MSSGLALYELNAAIYEIDAQINAYAEEHEGKIPEDLDAKLMQLEGERNDKLLSLGRYIKNLNAEAEAVKAEKVRLGKRQAALEHKAEAILRWVGMNLPAGEKLSDSCIAYSWRKSKSVEIIDADKIPEEFFVVTRTPDKTGIRDVLKNGGEIPGAALLEKLNLQLK